ncbi:MAG: zinc ribbon domain-containing protein [Acidobacteriota bacterium]|nr:zinc ribbon domain-containing protein [Blastocatellia bacterium]MDW8412757.1 zinc ribbon domain-containing protein [Acidobacteriota bacterium]
MKTTIYSFRPDQNLKKCPKCSNYIQQEAHYCQHCNTELIDIEGKPLFEDDNLEKWFLKILKALLSFFLGTVFYLTGLATLEFALGSWVATTENYTNLTLHVCLLLTGFGLAIYLSPRIIAGVQKVYKRLFI